MCVCDIDVWNRRIKISATLISISIEMKSKTQIPMLISIVFLDLFWVLSLSVIYTMAMKKKIPGGLFENEERAKMVLAFDAFV